MSIKKFLYATSLAVLSSSLLSTQTLAADFNSQPILEITPCPGSNFSDDDRLGLKAEKANSGTDNTDGLTSILISAGITAGIDFIGQQLTEAAEKTTEVKTATVNVFPDNERVSARCLTFKTFELADTKRVDGNARAIDFTLRLDGYGHNNGTPFYMRPKLTELNFHRTLSGKLNKKRGLMIQLAISRPGTTNGESQTITLGNLRTQDEPYGGTEDSNYVEFPTMMNPYVTKVTDGKGKVTGGNVGAPFTITVTLTEVKDANKALGFAASVFSEANDDLTSSVIESVSGGEPDDGAGQGG